MRRTILLYLLFGLIAVSAVYANDQATFQEAEQHLATGDYRLAYDRYTYLVNRYPESAYAPTAQFRLGQVNFYLGRYSEALSRLERVAVRYVEFQDRVHFWLGLTNYRLGEYASAVESFDRAVASAEEEEDGTVYLYRGLSHRHLGEIPEAIDDLESARKLGNRQEVGYSVAYLLELYVRTQSYETAVELWEETSSDLPSDDGFQAMRVRFAADAAYAADRSDLAAELYRDLTEYSMADAHWAFARLYRIAQAQGQSDRALEVFREAERRLGAEPERLADFWLDLGIDAFRREQFELSIVYLQRLWDIRNERAIQPSTAVLLAGALDGAERTDQAVSVLETALDELTDRNHTLRTTLAELYMSQGRYEPARTVLEDVPHPLPEDEQYRYLLALARHRTGDDAGALELLGNERYAPLRVEPRTGRLRSLLLLRAGDPVAAVRSFREYVTANTADPEVRLQFIQALLKASEVASAEQTLAEVEVAALTPGQRARYEYLTGVVSFERGRYDQAVGFFQRALDTYDGIDTPERALIVPDDARYYLGWSAYRSGQPQTALRALGSIDRDAIRDELRFNASYLEAWVHYQLQQYGRTAELLRSLLDMTADPEQERKLRRLLAGAYVASEQMDRAREEYRRLISLGGPDDILAQTWEDYAELLATTGRAEDALAAYANLHEQYPDTDPGRRAVIERGLLLLREQEELDQAREVFRSYLDTYPGGPEYADALYWAGRSAVQAGQPQAALLWWEPLAEDFSNSQYAPQVLAESARIYRDAGRLREALDLLERLIVRYPQAPAIAESRLLRDQLRLQLSGLTEREAELLARLQSTRAPDTGTTGWFDLVLELGRITVREQVAFTPLRAGVIDYLIQASSVENPRSAEAALLLAEYYQRRGERSAAIEHYWMAAQTPGAPPTVVGQSLFQLIQLYARAGQTDEAQRVFETLQDVGGISQWVDRARQVLPEAQQ